MISVWLETSIRLASENRRIAPKSKDDELCSDDKVMNCVTSGSLLGKAEEANVKSLGLHC